MSAGNLARDGRVVFSGVDERSLKELGQHWGRWGDGEGESTYRSCRDPCRDALFAMLESVVDEMG